MEVLTVRAHSDLTVKVPTDRPVEIHVDITMGVLTVRAHSDLTLLKSLLIGQLKSTLTLQLKPTLTLQ